MPTFDQANHHPQRWSDSDYCPQKARVRTMDPMDYYERQEREAQSRRLNEELEQQARERRAENEEK